MSEKFSNLWLLGKADVDAVDALFLQHVDLECNSILFNKRRRSRCSVQRADRECNLIQINKIYWVYALGLAASHKANLNPSKF